ncbi:MAG: hypothetical protein CMJ36_04495 [Phycisphaerae bacterium]|nr:hypothetical protein [Phycisphaerae bacterium]|tara:strand:+ start:571 stop:813 length:243 start_codon:yes stop_codon:yes gene_type:complete
MKGLDTVKGWARELIDLLLVFIVLGVVCQIIFGNETTGIPYFGEMTANLIDVIKGFGEGNIAGLIALLVIISLYRAGQRA